MNIDLDWDDAARLLHVLDVMGGKNSKWRRRICRELISAMRSYDGDSVGTGSAIKTKD